MNRLFYGDNLDVLRQHVADECVDLVYLDPPFNSNANYNVLFAERDGTQAAAQIQAFEDTWRWDEGAARAYKEVVEGGGSVSQAMQAFRTFLGDTDMLAYLAMMAPRLVELRRVLKPTGSLYLHCDSNASHYLKMLMDSIFGVAHFRNEIIWKRSHAHSDSRQGSQHFGRVTDTILFYTKGEQSTWHVEYLPYDKEYLDRDYRRIDKDGRRYRIDNLQGPGGAAKGNPIYEVMGVKRYWRYSEKKMAELIRQGRIIQTRPGAVPQYKRYLDEMPGVPVQNLWTDLPVLNNRSDEALGYPTQKPEALLDRIITASSNEGDVICDPFCGCGTTVASAQKLNRRWIGIDITNLAIGLIRHRLSDTYGEDIAKTYDVIGEPVSVADADTALIKLRDLARLTSPETPSVKVSNGEGAAIRLSTRLVENVEAVLAPEFTSIGTVEGLLQGLITHGKNRFLIFDPLSGRQVTCYFSDRIPWKDVHAAFGQRVAATGTIRSRRGGEKVSIMVTRLYVFPLESELPSAADVLGILKAAK